MNEEVACNLAKLTEFLIHLEFVGIPFLNELKHRIDCLIEDRTDDSEEKHLKELLQAVNRYIDACIEDCK